MIALLVLTDGRLDCLAATMTSIAHHLYGPITRWVMHDDSGDPVLQDRLGKTLRREDPAWELVCTPARAGFGGAIQSAWRHLRDDPKIRFVAHFEDDFVLTRPVNLAAMATVLTARPHLAQMALRRQAWNPTERAAGGVVECDPEAYADMDDAHGNQWLEHRLWWTTNPSLYRRDLTLVGWPDGHASEGQFSHRLLAAGMHLPARDRWIPPADVRFGYWGAREDGPWVEHIGTARAGTGY